MQARLGVYMDFDRNQSEFPSQFHRDIWWWAVGIVPIEESLTLTVAEKCGADVLAGCRQWRDYFIELTDDMYRNAVEYLPASPRQYRDILENVAAGGRLRGGGALTNGRTSQGEGASPGEGAISGEGASPGGGAISGEEASPGGRAYSYDEVIWSTREWEDYSVAKDKSKAYKTTGVKTERCLDALGRIGLTIERHDGEIAFINKKYPKIFHAMRMMEYSPNARKTPVRHHFAHCEFRQLIKSYSADYNGLLRRVGDESLMVAHAIRDFASNAKMQRYIHFDIIKYKYKGVRVLDFSVRGDEYPTMRVNIETGDGKIGINAHMSDMPKILELIQNRLHYIDIHSSHLKSK